MFLHIKQVVLWPKKPNLAPRTLNFESKAINVVNGTSKRGKSSLIPIIDYCLGSEHCTIPVKTIRDACSWFGIVIETENGQKLLARKEPGEQQSTGEMFIIEAPVVQVPEKIEGSNTSDAKVKALLDDLASLPSMALEPESPSGYKGRPSFRDMLAFCFQPQNVIANPNVLFFKADLHDNREKLKGIFPFALNALTSELLAMRWEADALRKELRIKDRELSAILKMSESLQSELRTWVSKAAELGLLEHSPEANPSPDVMLGWLRLVVTRTGLDSQISQETIQRAIADLIGLQREEGNLAAELSSARKRLTDLEQLGDSLDLFSSSIQLHRDRLAISDWLRSQPVENCVLCGSSADRTQTSTEQLFVMLKEAESTTLQVKGVPASLEGERLSLTAKVRTISERLESLRYRIRSLDNQSEEAKKTQYRISQVDRFIGNLEQALKYMRLAHSDSALREEVDRIKASLAALNRSMAEHRVRDKIDIALKQVSHEAATIVPSLDSERPNDAVTLDIEELTLKVAGQGRNDFLWEIGSGANWLSYHTAISLGLHRFFQNQPHSPVPSFLVLDQPSQVYFPKGWEPDMEEVDDEDVIAVKKFYSTLAKEVTKQGGKFQVILLDHPGTAMWAGIDNVNFVEEWRGGKALIPSAWLT